VGIRNLLIKNAEEALLDSKGMEAGGSHNLERLGFRPGLRNFEHNAGL
jgi:hypothetical protein